MTSNGRRSVTAYARPVRTAFLIDPNSTSESEINQIICHCCDTWGGRFSAVVPSDGESISKDWWTLLELADPDFIHSSVPLSDALIDSINRRVLPAKIIELDESTRKIGKYLEPAALPGLGIGSIPGAIWSNRDQFSRPEYFYYIKGTANNSPRTSFLARNFGILSDSIWTQRAFSEVPHCILDPLLNDPKQFIKEALEVKGGIVYPQALGQIQCSRGFRLQHDSFLTGHHIVVGDSAWDFLYAWNRALLSSWETSIPSFWLPSSFLDDDEWPKLLTTFLTRRGWSHHQSTHKVVSYSLAYEKVSKFAESLSRSFSGRFEPRFFAPGELLLPVDEGPMHSMEFYRNYQLPDATEDSLIELPKPSFATKKVQGTWAVDIELEMRTDPAKQYNPQPTWKVPRRIGLADAFVKYSESEGARVNRSGSVSIYPPEKDAGVYLREPPLRNLIWPILNQEPRTNCRRKAKEWKRGPFREIEASDKGIYLKQIVGLFGGLWWAGSTFEDKFWRSIFLELVNQPTESFDSFKASIEKILIPESRTEEGKFQFEPGELNQKVEKVANLIFKRRNALGIKALTHEVLQKRFEELRNSAIRVKDTSDFRPDEKFSDWKQNDLENLLESKVLMQGSVQACPACLSKQWYRVDDLKADMRCQNCFNVFPLSPSPEWFYKLNGLLENALAHHGTLAVIQALYLLQGSNLSGVFAYLPSQSIFKEDDRGERKEFTDIDIVAVVGGKLVFAEVKSQPHTIKIEEFDKLAELAEELLPDVVLIMAPENDEKTTWPDWLDERIRKLNEKLANRCVFTSKYLMSWKSSKPAIPGLPFR